MKDSTLDCSLSSSATDHRWIRSCARRLGIGDAMHDVPVQTGRVWGSAAFVPFETLWPSLPKPGKKAVLPIAVRVFPSKRMNWTVRLDCRLHQFNTIDFLAWTCSIHNQMLQTVNPSFKRTALSRSALDKLVDRVGNLVALISIGCGSAGTTDS